MSYIDMIKERARLDKKTIVLPESNDKRTLLAAARIVEEGIADIIMIGDEEKIMDGAGWLEVDLSKVTVVNPKTTPKLDDYVNLLYETRKAKGMTPEKAREILLNDYLTFGIVMVKANDADGPFCFVSSVHVFLAYLYILRILQAFSIFVLHFQHCFCIIQIRIPDYLIVY